MPVTNDTHPACLPTIKVTKGCQIILYIRRIKDCQLQSYKGFIWADFKILVDEVFLMETSKL